MKLLFLILFSSQLFAQTYETTVEDIIFNSSSRIVLSQEMILKSQSKDIPSLLATAANISITSTSFQPTSISIRGGDSGHVLILVDGIPFYDPSTIQRTGNLSTLNIKSVKSIEILKGSQSVLYGGQALGGVIKIETLPDVDSRNVLGQIGTQDHLAFGAEYSQNGLLVRGSHHQRNSESPAKGSSETYSSNKQNIDLAYKWKSSTDGYIKGTFLRDSGFSPSSDMNFQIVDVDNFKLSSEQGLLSSQVKFKNVNWRPKVSVGLQNGLRHFHFPSSALNPFPLDEDYKSNFQFIRLDLRTFESETMTVDLGINYSAENFVFQSFNIEEADAVLEQRGLFTKITNVIDSDTEFSYGGRLENWSNKDPVTVFQVGLTHKKSRAEVSTGYKAPTLYQLYSNFGNPDLNEEEGTQISLIQDFTLSESQNISVTLFNSRFKNLISTTGTFPAIRYVNIRDTETNGVELSYNNRFSQEQSVILNLSYQEPRDLDAHTWLPRRPLTNGSARYLFGNDVHQGTLELVYVGTRKDLGPSGTEIVSSYGVVNLGYNYSSEKTQTYYLRMDNIASSRYEETYGYFAEGISVIAGWTGSF